MTGLSRMAVRTVLVLTVAFACQSTRADDSDLDARLKELQQTVHRQQAQLDAQREQLEAQHELIRQLQAAQKGGVTVPAANPAGGSPARIDEVRTESPGGSAPAGDAASPEKGVRFIYFLTTCLRNAGHSTLTLVLEHFRFHRWNDDPPVAGKWSSGGGNTR